MANKCTIEDYTKNVMEGLVEHLSAKNKTAKKGTAQVVKNTVNTTELKSLLEGMLTKPEYVNTPESLLARAENITETVAAIPRTVKPKKEAKKTDSSDKIAVVPFNESAEAHRNFELVWTPRVTIKSKKENDDYDYSTGIVSMNTEEHFGNPFMVTGYVKDKKTANGKWTKAAQTKKLKSEGYVTEAGTPAEVTEMYTAWLEGTDYTEVQPERRDWILEQVNSGKLDDVEFGYYKDVKGPTHAKALRDFVANKGSTTTDTVPVDSNQTGLQYALTNPTHTSPKGKKWSKGDKATRGKLAPIEYDGTTYPDVESAYQANKVDESKTKPSVLDSENFALMTNLIAAKFESNPWLFEEVEAKGGLDYLNTITHQPTKANSVWETGGKDWFKKALKAGYTEASASSNTDRKVSLEEFERLNDARGIVGPKNLMDKNIANMAEAITGRTKPALMTPIESLNTAIDGSLPRGTFSRSKGVRLPNMVSARKKLEGMSEAEVKKAIAAAKKDAASRNKKPLEKQVWPTNKKEVKSRIASLEKSMKRLRTKEHETVHAATVAYMEDAYTEFEKTGKKDPLLADMERLFEESKDYLGDNPESKIATTGAQVDGKPYWASNVFEFVAEVMSNPDLMTEFSKIESTSTNKPLLSQFMEIVKAMVEKISGKVVDFEGSIGGQISSVMESMADNVAPEGSVVKLNLDGIIC